MYDYQSKTDCRAQTSLERVQDKCQDTTHCKLKSTTTFFNVDPCFGIFKYLPVKYKCDWFKNKLSESVLTISF